MMLFYHLQFKQLLFQTAAVHWDIFAAFCGPRFPEKTFLLYVELLILKDSSFTALCLHRPRSHLTSAENSVLEMSCLSKD